MQMVRTGYGSPTGGKGAGLHVLLIRGVNLQQKDRGGKTRNQACLLSERFACVDGRPWVEPLEQQAGILGVAGGLVGPESGASRERERN